MTLEQQHGRISRQQMRTLGFSDGQIKRTLANGSLVRELPAVFHVAGIPDSWLGRMHGCSLWLGDEWFAGFRSAARLWNLDGCTWNGIEFVGFGARPSRQGGILLHKKALIPRVHRTKRDGIPVTSATLTLIDLGAVVSPDAMEVALESAIRMGFTSHGYLERQLDLLRARGRNGCGSLHRLLRLRAGLKPTESVFETKLFQVLRNGGLPLPQRQIPVYEDGAFLGRPDFLYPERNVAIEALSKRHHFGGMGPDGDAARRNRLQAAGYIVLEITWTKMVEKPDEVVDLIRNTLASR